MYRATTSTRTAAGLAAARRTVELPVPVPVARYSKRSRVLPAVLAACLVTAALAEVVGRGSPNPPVRTQVLAERVVATPVPTPEPPVEPPPVVEATPVPSSAPRVRAAGSGARTSGPRIAAPARGWVQIPSVGTNAAMVRVGLDSEGNMITPTNAKDIAWLDNGSFPGPTRNAILAGHRNWKGVQGSLVRLEHAKPGDLVRVGHESQTYTFTITWVRQVHPDTADTQEILGATSVDSVTIITCGGQFNRQTRHYEERIVARGELVGIE